MVLPKENSLGIAGQSVRESFAIHLDAACCAPAILKKSAIISEETTILSPGSREWPAFLSWSLKPPKKLIQPGQARLPPQSPFTIAPVSEEPGTHVGGHLVSIDSRPRLSRKKICFVKPLKTGAVSTHSTLSSASRLLGPMNRKQSGPVGSP